MFNLVETIYFGQGVNKGFILFPRNVADFICNTISFIIMFVGLYLIRLKMFKQSDIDVIEEFKIKFK